jgi:hypothetical protein
MGVSGGSGGATSLKVKATNTHSEYVIRIAFPLQQWLHERASMLRYTYIACFVMNFVLKHLKMSSCWSKQVVFQRVIQHISTMKPTYCTFYSIYWIKGLYMFRALITPSEDEHCNRATANWHYKHAIYQVRYVERLLRMSTAIVAQPTDIIRTQYTNCRLLNASWGWALQSCHNQLTLYARNILTALRVAPPEDEHCNRGTANWHFTHAIYQVPLVKRLLCMSTAIVPQPTDIRTQYTKCCLCSASWGWASNARSV